MTRNATWVLLRGLMRDRRHWGGFPAQLGQALPGAHIVPVDLPGNGSLYARQSPDSVAAMAASVRDQLRQLGRPPPYHVVAMSLGAMVTVAWAEAHPDELAGAVLVNTSLRPFSRFHERLRPAAWPLLLRLALGQPGPAAVEAGILQLTTRSPAVATVLPQWIAWRQSHPVSRGNALRQLRAAIRYRAPQMPPRVPMLLLNGAADGLVSPRCSARLAQAWGLPLRVHPEAGHDLPLDDGAWVAAQVADWAEATIP